jgi:DNA-directed RNA polymerase specialized sigma24 family protein
MGVAFVLRYYEGLLCTAVGIYVFAEERAAVPRDEMTRLVAAGLTERQIDIHLLAYRRGMSDTEIAVLIGVARATVTIHKQRGAKRLKNKLSEMATEQAAECALV